MQYIVGTVDHEGQPEHKCTLCGKVCKKRSNMKRHMILMHTVPTNECCKYCGKVFKNKYYLDSHIRSRECLSTMFFDPNIASWRSKAIWSSSMLFEFWFLETRMIIKRKKDFDTFCLTMQFVLKWPTVNVWNYCQWNVERKL